MLIRKALKKQVAYPTALCRRVCYLFLVVLATFRIPVRPSYRAASGGRRQLSRILNTSSATAATALTARKLTTHTI